MEFDNIFQRGMVALRDLLNEAAQKNPDLSRVVNVPGGDPDIEKVLEGFAFLTSRLQQKLDDELPEIIHPLFTLLWPNYLRPFPAATILEYQPTANITDLFKIPKGTQIESGPVDQISCVFQTVFDVDLLPLVIKKAFFQTIKGNNFLSLDFMLTAGDLGSLSLKTLKLYLAGPARISGSLLHTLLHNITSVQIYDITDNEEIVIASNADILIRPIGFRRDELLYPHNPNTPLGDCVLQEYYLFPEKYKFIEFSGLKEAVYEVKQNRGRRIRDFKLRMALSHVPDHYDEIQKEHFRLYCTPAINLFPIKLEPILIEDISRKYRIEAGHTRPGSRSVYAVTRVASTAPMSKSEIVFPNQMDKLSDIGSGALPPNYSLDVQISMDGKEVDTFLSFHNVHSKSLIDLELLCTNGSLASNIGTGHIFLADDNTDGTPPYKNITSVTAFQTPPLTGDILWKILSNMRMPAFILTDVPALRSILRTFNFRAANDREAAIRMEKELNSITSIKTSATDRIFMGMPIRGLQTTLELESSAFPCEGELYLFGMILESFLARFAHQNNFYRQKVRSSSGAEYQWPMRLGATIQPTDDATACLV